MSEAKTHKRLIATVLAALAIVGGLASWAMASGKAAPVKSKLAPVTKPAEVTTGTDTDNIQEGDQTTPDTASVKKAATVKSAETETTGETPAVEEPGDSNLPGGGHADPSGDTQHEFNGVE